MNLIRDISKFHSGIVKYCHDRDKWDGKIVNWGKTTKFLH